MTYPKVSSDPAASHDAEMPGAALGVPASPRFPEIEEHVLAYWEKDGTFQASVDNRDPGVDGDNEFVFYDGPPFANGLPHYGHLLTGYVKDIVPRYQTMRGRRVERRFGWDTHGLPAELEAMSQLGIKTKDEILELGIATFNAKCRESVLTYTSEWREYVTRQARWVDFDHDYKTLNPDYMESVVWAFKQLYEKGLVYEGFRVLPYCWNDQTPLSNHELRMDDDVYQMRQDPAVTVGLRLETGEIALVWTTTPWTLTANLGIMVHPDIDYVVVESDFTGTTERYLIAEARLAAYARELGEDAGERVVQRLKGSELLGRSYAPPFTYFRGHPKAHTVMDAEFVTTTDGTGLVHTAGAFGEEDKQVTDAHGIKVVVPVGPDGRFIFPVEDYQGIHVFDANALIIEHLKAATRGEGETGSVTPGHRAGAPRDLRPRLPALLALPGAADLHGGVVLVRRGDAVQGPHDRAQRADHVGARAHQAGAVRQVARERPRLVDLAKPVLGQPDSRVEVRRPAVSAGRRLRVVRGARARLRRRGHRSAPAVHRPAHAPQSR